MINTSALIDRLIKAKALSYIAKKLARENKYIEDTKKRAPISNSGGCFDEATSANDSLMDNIEKAISDSTVDLDAFVEGVLPELLQQEYHAQVVALVGALIGSIDNAPAQLVKVDEGDNYDRIEEPQLTK